MGTRPNISVNAAIESTRARRRVAILFVILILLSLGHSPVTKVEAARCELTSNLITLNVKYEIYSFDLTKKHAFPTRKVMTPRVQPRR